MPVTVVMPDGQAYQPNKEPEPMSKLDTPDQITNETMQARTANAQSVGQTSDPTADIKPYVPEGGWHTASTQGQAVPADSVAPRTLMDIARDLEAAQKVRATARQQFDMASALIAKLNAEVRSFGVKKRGARKETEVAGK